MTTKDPQTIGKAAKSATKSLTPKQERLARERAKGKTYEECAKEAGYGSRQSAHRAVVTNDDVQARMAELLGEGWEELELSPKLVTAGLIREAMKAESDGARVRAYELLGKTEAGGGLFTDRVRNENVDPEQSVNEAADLVMAYLVEHNHEAEKADVLLWIMGHYGLSH